MDKELMTPFMFWFLTGLVSLLFGGFMYLVLRYMKSSDDNFSTIKTRLNNSDATQDEHEQEMREVVKKMGESEVAMGKAANQMREDALKFRSNINQELLNIHQKTTAINATLEKATDQLADLSSTVQSINNTTDAHHKSLSNGAQAMKTLSNRIGAVETTLTKLKGGNILVSQKTNKKD